MDVPPLRAREGDIEILSLHFLLQCAEQYESTTKRLNPSTASWFEEYGWPGNVRELENLIHREFLLADGETLCIKRPSTLPVKPAKPTVGSAIEFVDLSYKTAKTRALQEFDRSYLTQLIQRAQGNVTRAAELAGKERRALGKLLKRYHIEYAPEREEGRSSR
jgi:transcriptional regulator with GAF, ATPase, and Fis domain